VIPVTIFGYPLALWTSVWAIVTAETDVEIEIADIVAMRSPINPYFREPCAAVDLLDFFDSSSNLQLLTLATSG
jgi:hypothetical protein